MRSREIGAEGYGVKKRREISVYVYADENDPVQREKLMMWDREDSVVVG